MTAKDQPDGQNGEIPADVPIPLPKNWLLPIRNIARTGSSAAEKLTTFILRPAPVLMSAIILAITFFSILESAVWLWRYQYTDIQSRSYADCLSDCRSGYADLDAVYVFFTLSGIRHGTGRGLTYFVLVYVLSYLFSLAAAAIPADVQLLTGIRGGILVFGSLYPAYFPFCVVGIITCILRKILK